MTPRLWRAEKAGAKIVQVGVVITIRGIPRPGEKELNKINLNGKNSMLSAKL